MSNPSLLCVPYRFKTSTLYSQIPDSGLGDFVVSRSASNAATRVNAAGFIETVADNVPRLDYPLGGITAGCPALLVEPSAQNLALQSAAFATSPWNLTNATSPNTTATTDPFGQTNADLFTATANFGKTQQQVTRTASGAHTVSCFVKGVSGVASIGSLIYNRGVGFTITSGGVVTVNAPVGYTQAGTIGVENYGNGWYRVFAVLTHFTTPGTDGVTIDTSVSGNSFYIFGAQVEAGSLPTSYIPTTTGPVTRGAETIVKATSAGLIGTNEGTIYAEVLVRANSANSSTRRIINIRADGSNVISLELGTTGLGASFIVNSTAGGNKTIGAGTLVAGVNKIAAGYSLAAQGMAVYLNGVFVASDTLTAIPSLQSAPMAIGSRADQLDGTIFNDRIRAVTLYPTRLPNTGPLSLQSLTQ